MALAQSVRGWGLRRGASKTRGAGRGKRVRAMAQQATKKALVPIADGSEEMEAVITADVLVRGGVEVVVGSAKEDGSLQCTMSRGVKLVADKHVSECREEAFDVVAVPGGAQGAENLGNSEPLDAILRDQWGSGRLVAAICAAPVKVLTPKGIMEGIKGTAHPGFSPQLPDPSSQEARVVVEGNVVTSRGPGTAFEFALCLIEHLYGRDHASKLGPPMVLPVFKSHPTHANEWIAPQQ